MMAWLVERDVRRREDPVPRDPVRYLVLTPSHDPTKVASWCRWTADVDKAFRCARREDAEHLIRFFGFETVEMSPGERVPSDVAAVEHMWEGET